MVAGIEKAVPSARAADLVARLRLDRIGVLSAATALLSNLVSNVPAVLVFRPFVAHLADPRRAWLASTLAGNLTLLGSVANLIVGERARADVRIGFREHLKAGVPLSAATIAIGMLLLR